MRVLKNNLNNGFDKTTNNIKPYPRKLICEMCGSELEYEESDMRMGEYGYMFIDCPLCKCDNMLEDNEKNIILTSDNIEFPTHFYHVSKENGAVDMCNNEYVKKYIREGVDFLRVNKDEWRWSVRSGNLCISILRLDDEESYDIVLTNDFYAIDIPFETVDFELICKGCIK